MPTREEHVGKAEENEAALDLLRTLARHPGWQATLLFYAALHYVDAYLHATGVLGAGPHRRSHLRRLGLVDLHLGSSLRSDFVMLQLASEQARYEAVPVTAEYVAALHQEPFTRIRTHVRTALGLSP